MLSVTIDGIDDLARDFRRCEDEVSNSARRSVDEGTKAGVSYAKANHRYTDRTGKLTGEAFASVETSSPGGAYGFMKWPAEYATFVENGTRPHLIVGNPWLSFVWKGVRVFFRRVNHPGTKPYAFGGDAYFVCERVMLRVLEEGVVSCQRILDS